MAVTPIRVLLVDDHPHIHDVVTRLLEAVDDILLVGQAYNGEDALRLCPKIAPDLILMDVVLPGMSGIEATQAVLERVPSVRVLVLSSYNEYEYIRAMLASGATGYLVKDALVDDLIMTIRSTIKGNTVLSPQVARLLIDPPSITDHPPHFGLTERELQVLELLAQGYTNAQIAITLNISQPTVRFHLNNSLAKMNVDTRSEALVLAARTGLI
ncbi:MAG: response regulator [Chloroflexota bacterium]